jgi:SPP1 gp7 family putative phage head morphogenesis protein
VVSLLETAARNRAALLRQDRAAGADLLRAYALVRRRLQADLDALTARIAQARAAGETVNRAWLAREVRYHSLLAQVEAQVGQFARVAEGRIRVEQRRAVLAGGEQAGALIRAALPDGGVGVAFNRLPTQALGELVGVLGDGSPLSSLLGQLGPQAGQAVRAALIEGVGIGLGPRQIAREVVKATNLSAVRALRIARNETLRAFRSASQETYKANADVLRGWVWWASISRRTCPVCIAMHGTFHSLDETFASHVACRCVQLPMTRAAPLRVERGADAFRRMKADDQRAILGVGKFLEYSAGRLDLADLVARTRDARWGPGLRERGLRETQAMKQAAD